MINNETYCCKPFSEICNIPGKHYTPCCWSFPKHEKDPNNLENPNTMLPLDCFDGENFRKLRRDMIAGEKTDFLKSYCHHCFELEESIGRSPRTDSFLNNKEYIKNFNLDGSLKKDTKNRFIYLSLNFYGISCNLQCYYCEPTVSTSRQKAFEKIENLDDTGVISKQFLNPKEWFHFDTNNQNQFNKIVNQVLEYADIINAIEIVGGEPMLMKTHFILLDKLIENNKSFGISLNYTSNMTLMNVEKMKKYFENFRYTHIQWSVDALEERNHWLRFPTNWNQTIKNVFEIQSYFKKNKNGEILATITPTLLGIVSLRKTYNWILTRNLLNKKTPIFNILSKPSFLRTRNLPNSIKEKIANDIKIISEPHYNDLMHERDDRQFELAVKYFDLLDQSRGTNWRSTFPEVAKYAN